MSTKGKNIKQRSSGDFDDGDCLSHMPTATCEQLNIAKILQKPGNDHELKHYVSQLRELTQCTEDEAVTALYDCENNLERAVDLLLDKFRCGNDNEWQTSVGKRTKTKVRLNTDSTSDETATSVPQKEVDTTMNERDVFQPEKQVMVPPTENKSKKDRKPKRSFPNRSTRGGEVTDSNSYKTLRGAVPKSDKMEMGERINKERSCNEVDGWDPYTEYGEWTGELIEVINSDVNIAKGLEDYLVLHSDLLVESDSGSTRLTSDSDTKIDQHGHEPLTLGDSSDDTTDLFVKAARSKRPPPAFTNRPNVDLYFSPDVLPNIKSKLRYVFGGDWAAHVLLAAGRTNDITSLRAPPAIDPSERSTFNSSRNSSTNILKAKAKTGSMDSLTVHTDKTKSIHSSFTDNNVSTNSASIKNAPSLQGTQKGAPNSALISEDNAHPSSLIEPSYKDYILDGLPNSVSKMTVEEDVSNSESYIHRPSTSDSQNAGPSYIDHRNAVAAPMPTQKNTVSHGSANTQTTTTSHTQQSTTIPHPVPHFVGQFAPSPYMFNMPGSSGNPAALFELDQLQLFQQHRMLYDMQFQPQAATTVQNVLPPTETSTGKNSVQGLPASFAHVTAANTTVRPDIITSAVGHATQLMQTGHPYFHYPRFFLMNGYHNTYLNQQQSGQDGSTSGSANSQLSNAAVIHGALPVTQPDGQSQPYNNMKVTHAYNDLSDLKYGDPSKQIGFKSGSGQQHQQPYFPFNGQGGTEATKPMPPTTLNQVTMSGGAASSAGYPTPGNAVHYSQQQQSQQFYPPVGASPYFTAAAAVAAAAVAAASAQQQQQQHVIGGAGSQLSASSGSSTGPSQVTHMHPQAGAPAMVYPGAGLHVHHSGQQRSAIPH